MATENVKFFDPADLLAFTGWVRQTPQKNTTKSRASALGADGDEIASQDHGDQTQITVPFVSTGTDGNLTLPQVGAIQNGYHIDGFTLTYVQAGFPTLSVNAHKHGSSAHDTCRTYTPTLTCPAQFGIPDLDTTAAGSFCGFLVDKVVGMRSLTYSMQVNHVDENKGDGSHLAGDNSDATETVGFETTGIATITAPAAGTGGRPWTCDSAGENTSNVAASTASASFTRHVAHDTPSSCVKLMNGGRLNG